MLKLISRNLSLAALALFLTCSARSEERIPRATLTLNGIADTLLGRGAVSGRSGHTNQLSAENRASIQNFSQTTLTEANQNTQTVYYPFGGPDAIYPSLMFPSLKTLLLVGLENPGNLPDLNAAGRLATAGGDISEIASAFADFTSYSYFVTANMSTQLRDYGTTTIICVGLRLLGYNIISVQGAQISANGTLSLGGDPVRVRGVRVAYRKPGDLSDREVIYFRQDLASIGGAFTKFVEDLNVDTAFYKASSYVPHGTGTFKAANDLALNARFIVQSDTGLPFRLLSQDPRREIHLFGVYVAPHNMFGTKVQPGLRNIYGNLLCRARDGIAHDSYSGIWGINPCDAPREIVAAQVSWDGILPFRFDYASNLSTMQNHGRPWVSNRPNNWRFYASNLIYVIRR